MAIDLIFVVLTYVAAHFGFKRGLIEAVINLGGWLLAVVFAIKLTPWGTAVLNSVLGSDGYFVTVIAAFGILVFLFLKIINAIGRGLEGTLKMAHIDIFNGLMGSVFYWCLFMLAYGVALRAIDKYGLLPTTQKSTSRIYYQLLTRYTDQASSAVTYLIPIGVSGFYLFSDGVDRVDSTLRKTIPPSQIPSFHLYPSQPLTPPPAVHDDGGGLHSVFDVEPPPARQQPRKYQHAQ
ncbi:MAG: hypothetical protein RI894_2420 [Bacteroidota bacterium]|jgi:uncharacterized membrane protein required for colicin V production